MNIAAMSFGQIFVDTLAVMAPIAIVGVLYLIVIIILGGLD